MISYRIGDNLYLNITNRCTNDCCFCVRNYSPGVAGYDLRLTREPSVKEVINKIGIPTDYKEIVFCGFGEPLIRLEAVKEISTWIKENGGYVRVDTNGLGSIFHGRNTARELKGLVDAVSISLNAETAEKYEQICRPVFGIASYKALINFIKESKKYIPYVRVSVVDLPEVDILKCRQIADDLGVDFHIRHYSG